MSSAPIVRNDRAINDGYLMVVEPGHSMSTQLGSGVVPVNNSVIDNLAAGEARRLIVGSASDVTPTFILGSDVGSAKWKLERTPKGGLHGIVSQTTDTINTIGYVNVPAPIKQYMLNNLQTQTLTPTTGHQFAMFAWRMVTRAGITGGLGDYTANAIVGSSAGSLFQFGNAVNSAGYGGGTTSASGNLSTLAPSAQPLNVHSFRGQMAYSWPASTLPTLAALTGAVGWGPIPSLNYSGYAHFSPSFVLYRFVIVDLTVLGMTYLDAETIEYTEWLAATSPAGTVIPAYHITKNGVSIVVPARVLLRDGRYYNDTIPTAPSTIA